MTRSSEKGERNPGKADKPLSLNMLKLNIGESLQMQPLTDQARDRYYVKLIGHVEKRSVLVTTPVVDGAVLLMREGQAFVMRGFSGKDAYAFNVNILRVCNVPFPYLHLTYPQFVQSAPVRRDNRVRVSIIGSVTNLSDSELQKKLPGVIVDLSATGALLDTREDIGNIGDRLNITLRLTADELDAYLTLGAVIRGIRMEDSEGQPDTILHHGVEFQDISANDNLILQNFVYRKIIEGL